MMARWYSAPVFFLLACGSQELTSARAPMLSGKADTNGDSADQACQIVLRQVGRTPGNNDYHTICQGDVCDYEWRGSVEVAEGAIGEVGVLYRLASDPIWRAVQASVGSNPQPGFVRYDFSIYEHLFGPSDPASTVELIPYIEQPDGSRVFDHNRRPGSFDTYRLDETTGFALGDDGTCAPVVGRISFLPGWSEHPFGRLHQEGYLAIDYALDRLPDCRGTHNGYPAWDIVAHVRFSPGGQELTGSVSSRPLSLRIPQDATAVEIWFHNFTGAGSSCQAWDSRHGQNYRYEVWPSVTSPRCVDIQAWERVNSDMPYRSSQHCLAYDIEQQYAADNCELHLEGIGHGYMGHYGIPNNWLEATIVAGPQLGELLGVGMLTRFRDQASGKQGQRVTFGREVAPRTWQTGFIFHAPGFMGSGAYHRNIEAMAFFVDVRRPTGEVVRLWQSRHGANYSWDDAFSLPTTTEWIPYGNIQYAAASSPIFDARRSCAP